MLNVESVKTCDMIPPAIPDELLEDDRKETEKKAAAARLKAKVLAQAAQPTRLQVAISMAIDMLDSHFKSMHSFLMEETAKRCDESVLDSLNLIEVGRDYLSTMRQKHYRCYDDCSTDFVKVGAIHKALHAFCGERDDVIGNYAKGSLPYIDVLLEMIEIAEVSA